MTTTEERLRWPAPPVVGARGLPGAVLTTDGGARQAVADLWCTYAAVRTLRRLGRAPADPDAAAAFLRSHENRDGGFAWQKGLQSDVWATFYCTQALADLGHSHPRVDALAGWLERLATPAGGFAMTPGQAPDVWATYYAVRSWVETIGRPPPDARAVGRWIARTQRASGGLAWNERSDTTDTRASYYGAVAHARLSALDAASDALDVDALCAWLRARQRDGGFSFKEGDATPCMWATFRATAALHALGAEPSDPDACARWIMSMHRPDGGFARWEWYEVSDVWACFCAVGALQALGVAIPPATADAIARFLRRCQLRRSGFTYRHPEAAGDSLATAAVELATRARTQAPRYARCIRTLDRSSCAWWLVRAQMPTEGGVMYMPGRGAELRCTLWAASALDGRARGLDRARIARWLRELQNPDGGWGYWEGRASDIVATTSALEICDVLGLEWASIDVARAREFVSSCATADGVLATPGGVASLSTTCQGIRALLLCGDRARAEALAPAIERHASRLGGYAAEARGVPQLAATYQTVLTLQKLGAPWDRRHVGRLLRHLRRDAGYAWSPLADTDGGPLATCLALLLEDAVADVSGIRALPRLNL